MLQLVLRWEKDSVAAQKRETSWEVFGGKVKVEGSREVGMPRVEEGVALGP